MIVRIHVDDAVEPLRNALSAAQQRIAELERRPAAPPPPIARAVAAPARAAAAPTFVATGAARPGPVLDVAAIEREVPIDVDVRSFDGGRRRRRLAVLLAVALIVLFGGLAALLAESYAHTHP